MILPLPAKYDANEIFIILSTVLTFVLMFALPRRLSAVTFTIIWTFNIFLALLADVTIAVKPYELYFSVDEKTYELFDFVLNSATYPTVPYFVVNFYQRIQPRGLQLLMYVLLCAGVASALEWISVQFHVFTYTGWKLYLSFLVYIVVFAVNIWLSNFIEKRHPCKSSSRS
ncbi:hypothetical protein A8990_1698 [Paenibacillus taihuensis]|uniref:Uncharacterized protein n=1 Tax=Paenibacillus taihuensis TaxID=1156355 RepID=A0A3D9Q0F8_9BACL|nr:hypothetical protein A8990_1698 [Paenibacillus taihuensis]